ncbi:MAG: hypothetical protein KC613_08250 [Myxococcales bacterium]|nr:hypothetical protein [Myxococcales bacterium]
MSRLLVPLLLGAAWLWACDDDPSPAPTPTEAAWAVPAAGPDPALGVYMSAWGPSAESLFTVGGQPDAGVIWRRDAAGWTRLSPPDGPLLNWVQGAAGVLWVVGDGGRALRSDDGGQTFTAVPTPTDAPLWGVWAGDADTVWAVGGDARAAQADWAPVLLRLDGDAFQAVPLPAVDRDFAALFKVWGSGPGDVVAVGARGVLLHFDGQAWTQQPVVGGTADDLISVWGTGPDRVFVAGGRSNALALQRTPAGWQKILPDTLAARPGLNGVWVAPDGTASLVGLRGAALRLTPTGELLRDRTDTSLVLHAVFGAGDRRVAVGGSLDSNPPWTGLVLEDAP